MFGLGKKQGGDSAVPSSELLFSYQSIENAWKKRENMRDYGAHHDAALGHAQYRTPIITQSAFEIVPRETYTYDYKIHLFPKEQDTGKAWDAIVPILTREGIHAKLFSPEAVRANEASGSQRGKSITLYADYVDGPHARDWQAVLTEMVQALRDKGITPGNIPYDKAVIHASGGESMMAYRDEREKKRSGWSLPPHTPLPDAAPDDPFARMVLDAGQDIKPASPTLVRQQRTARIQFAQSPMTPREIKPFINGNIIVYPQYAMDRVAATVRPLLPDGNFKNSPRLQYSGVGVTLTDEESSLITAWMERNSRINHTPDTRGRNA